MATELFHRFSAEVPRSIHQEFRARLRLTVSFTFSKPTGMIQGGYFTSQRFPKDKPGLGGKTKTIQIAVKPTRIL